MSIFSEEFQIVELYTEQMNIYGDTGNSLVLKKRMEMYGLKANILQYNIGDSFPPRVDILVAGGGQDSAQLEIVDDLRSIKDNLRLLIEDSTPALAICGMYQLFGEYFMTANGEKIEGLGILDARTIASDKRLIGNVIAKSKDFGLLVGYENHSGQTFLGDKAIPLSQDVVLGVGNNSSSGTEGALYKNLIGTYLHGPFLPKNPRVADFLINQAVSKHMGYDITLTHIDVTNFDKVVDLARNTALKLGR
jgi:CobQ-like glutamine amidotransferase family enzyme